MKSYFSFTRGQQVGVIVWSVIIVVSLIILKLTFNARKSDTFSVNQSDLEYVRLNTLKSDNSSAVSFSENSPEFSYTLFDFDPNIIVKSDWENLGFSSKQADAILNYRAKFGPFKSKEDLKNVFVISDNKYAELEPFIKLNQSGNSTEKQIQKQIQINSTTAIELESLPGIGKTFADRIIKFRNSLGGFYSMTQLHEVYNMNEDIYQILVDNCELVSTEIKKIRINHASKDEIDRHPYIDFEVTASILKEREKKPISSLDFLVEKNVISIEEKNQIEPYISFE